MTHHSSSNDNRTHYTTPVSTITRSDCDSLIRLALDEDCPEGDPTSESIFSAETETRARVVANEKGVLCGGKVVEHLTAHFLASTGIFLRTRLLLEDGDRFEKGDVLLEIEGSIRGILRLERIILNFLQYLSGISTSVAEAVAQADDSIQILDTRKTLPGYRKLAKYAVYCGGGTNHRINLSEMALIKDNHVAAAGGVAQAVERVRSSHPTLPLELEVDTLEQLAEALPLKPQMVLLDNMGRQEIARALEMVESLPLQERPEIEVSGGWKPERLHELRGLGELRVSMGSLTTHTRFLDLSMEIF